MPPRTDPSSQSPLLDDDETAKTYSSIAGLYDDQARKRTTQKVNLYEKVQIPAYEDAIRKIKRFLEDEENLAKSAQKIVKNRRATAEEVEEN